MSPDIDYTHQTFSACINNINNNFKSCNKYFQYKYCEKKINCERTAYEHLNQGIKSDINY